MSKRFERFAKMAKEEFGLTVVRSNKRETFKDIFGIELTENCDNSNETLQVVKCETCLPMDDYTKKTRKEGFKR